MIKVISKYEVLLVLQIYIVYRVINESSTCILREIIYFSNVWNFLIFTYLYVTKTENNGNKGTL